MVMGPGPLRSARHSPSSPAIRFASGRLPVIVSVVSSGCQRRTPSSGSRPTPSAYQPNSLSRMPLDESELSEPVRHSLLADLEKLREGTCISDLRLSDSCEYEAPRH